MSRVHGLKFEGEVYFFHPDVMNQTSLILERICWMKAHEHIHIQHYHFGAIYLKKEFLSG